MALVSPGLTLPDYGQSDFISGMSVANYSALPAAADNVDKLAIVLNSEGVWPLPSYHAKGIYYSDGATWEYQGDYVLTDEASEIQFSTAGNITATNVQSAIMQMDSIKAGSGFTTATTSGSQLVGTLGTNGISLGVPAWLTTAAAGGGAAISAGAVSQNTGTVNFANSNGITFGLSNNGTFTASHNGITQQSTQPVAYSAANGSANFSTLTFANSNGISFSTGTQGLFASHNALTSQSNQAVSAANGSFAFQTVTFANSNGVSFSTGTQGLFASHNGITQQSTQPVAYSAANGSANFSTLTFANSNGVSFSSGTQGLFASHNGLTSQSNQAFSAAGGSSAFQTLSFADSNGVSFSNSNGSVVATVATTYAASNHSHGNPTLALTNLSGTTASASNGLTLSLSGHASIGIATQVYDVASAGSTGTVTRYAPEDHRHAGVYQIAAGSNVGTTAGDTIPKHGLWVLAVSGNGTLSGSTGAGGVHTAWISIPSAAAAPVGVSAGTTSSNLATINFADAGGVSFGLNGGTVTGSWNSTHSHGNPTLALTNISGTTASASNGLTLSLSAQNHSTLSYYMWPMGAQYIGTSSVTMGNSSMYMQPFLVQDALSPSYIRHLVSLPAFGQTSQATSASTVTADWYATFYANIFSNGVGANSKSLQLYTAATAGITHRWLFTLNATGNSYAWQITFPFEGNNTANTGTSYTQTSASASWATTGQHTAFTGFRWLDIPLTQSIPVGQYWMQFQRSTSSATTGGNFTNTTGLTSNMTVINITQASINANPFNSAANSTNGLQLGLGVYTTNSSGGTTNSIPLNGISTVANQPVIPFQIIRQA